MANTIARLLAQLRIPIPVALGGTGASTLDAAKSALGISSLEYEYSSLNTYTVNSNLTMTHGLGVVPKRITLEAVCVLSPNLGFPVGDILPLGESSMFSAAGSNWGHSFSANNVYITLNIGVNGLAAIARDTRILSQLSTASWQLRVKASKK